MAQAATPEEVADAARYYAALPLPPRVQVLERVRIPRQRIAAWIYSPAPGGGTELLGTRLVESAPDFERHERRDETLIYVAYVPPGSLRRGRAIAATGSGHPELACTACHGAELRGIGPIPPLAGRSPTYLLRQLYAFRGGARAAPSGAPMQAVATFLSPADLLAAAAFAASLPP